MSKERQPLILSRVAETGPQKLARRALVAGAAVTALVTGGNIVETDSTPRQTRTEVIQPGDTVWGHAEPFARQEGVDIRDVVDDINDNSPDLDDGVANIGDEIQVPVSGQDQRHNG